MSDYHSRNGSTSIIDTNDNNIKGNNRQDKSVHGTTPIGVAVYPNLVVPNTRFEDNGTYSLKLRLPDGPEADKLIAKIDEVQEQAFIDAVADAPNAVAKKKIKKSEPSYTRDLDRDTGEDTGHWLFNFKMKASGVSKKTGKRWTRKPALFDAKGVPITNLTKNEDIWTGSVVRVAYELRPYYSPSWGALCSQSLQAVQIIELVSGEGKSAGDFGFGEEDGSFSAESATTSFDAPVTNRSLAESGDDGDF